MRAKPSLSDFFHSDGPVFEAEMLSYCYNRQSLEIAMSMVYTMLVSFGR